MNKARLKILAEVLNGAGLPDKFQFDMDTFYIPDPECGTAGCIAGLAVHLFGDRTSGACKTKEQGARLLGLKDNEAEALFYARFRKGSETTCLDLEKVKKRHAAAVLNHAVKTGKIDWTKAPAYKKLIYID